MQNRRTTDGTNQAFQARSPTDGASQLCISKAVLLSFIMVPACKVSSEANGSQRNEASGAIAMQRYGDLSTTAFVAVC